MTNSDKRQSPRIYSHNIIFYVCYDKKGDEITQGMGRTLNTSEGGILLETHTLLTENDILSLAIGLEEDIMDFKGIITFSKKRENGQYESGIQFLEIDEPRRRVLKQYMKIFNGQELKD